MKKEYICQSTLLGRGWTKTMIEQKIIEEKVYFKDISDIIKEKFNNVRLFCSKSVCYTWVDKAENYIGVANKTFKTWDEATEFAKTLPNGAYYIGIKPSGKKKYIALALISIK